MNELQALVRRGDLLTEAERLVEQMEAAAESPVTRRTAVPGLFAEFETRIGEIASLDQMMDDASARRADRRSRQCVNCGYVSGRRGR